MAGEEQYSRFALDSLLVESGTRVARLDELVYELVGGPGDCDGQGLDACDGESAHPDR